MLRVFSYYADNGGWINGGIFFCALVTLFLATGKYLQLRKVRQLLRQKETSFFSTTQITRNKLREHLLEMIPSLDEGFDTLVTLIQVAPLLGLFGTVVGMIKTFSLITTFGAGNPVILTEGITVSLLTTQAGLLVAFPSMLLHNHLKSRKESLVHDLLAMAESRMEKEKEIASAQQQILNGEQPLV